MKIFAFIAVLALAITLYAVPHYRSRPRPRPSPAAESFRRVPWQNIAAGGAAVSGVVLSYKVGDGIEEGLKTVAREDPDSFASAISPFSWLFPVIVIIVIACAGYVVWRKYFQVKLTQQERIHHENQQE